MTTNGTTEQPDAAAERAAFFASIAAEMQQIVADAFQQGLTAEQLQERYQAVLERAGERLATHYRVPAAYLPDILPLEQRVDLLLAALAAVAVGNGGHTSTAAAASRVGAD